MFGEGGKIGLNIKTQKRKIDMMEEVFSINIHDSYVGRFEIGNNENAILEIKEAYRYKYVNIDKCNSNEYCDIDVFDMKIAFNKIKKISADFLCDGNEFLISNCDFFIGGSICKHVDLGSYKDSSMSLVMMNFDKIEIHSEDMHLERLNS